jgi:hypothetical protein
LSRILGGAGARRKEACVTRLTMLVTPDGQWVLPDSPEFLAALGDASPDYDAVAFAVKNFGFIKFVQIQRSIIEIELHPRNVGFPALLAVQQQLLTSPVRLFRIKFFDTSWHSEISSSPEDTIARLSELCAPACTPPFTERFIVTPKDFSKLYEDETDQWRPLAQKWRISFANFDASIIPLAAAHRLLSRLMVIGVKPRQSDPVWRFIGDGHKWIGGRYQLNGIGEKVADMPDKDYGAWVAEFYRSVAASGQPRYDLVSADLHYEDEAGRPHRPVSYERLLLPWKTPSEEVFLTMCSRVAEPSAEESEPPSFPSSALPMKLAKSS